MNKQFLIEGFREVRVCHIVDALRALNVAHKMVMDPAIHPIKPGYNMRGFAFTVRYIPTQEPYSVVSEKARATALNNDPASWQEGGKGGALDADGWYAQHIKVRQVLDQAQPLDVLVIDIHGLPHIIWGSTINMQAIAMGLAGVITDGGTRKIYELRDQELPIFTRFESSVYASPEIELAQVNERVVCGGVQVRPGDIICGDDDGVVVVPIKFAEEVLRIARVVSAVDEAKKAEWLDAAKSRYGESWRKELRARMSRTDVGG